MPRKARLDIPGLVYHVMGRGIEGRDIFQDQKDREGFLKRLSNEAQRPGGPRLYAWALLPNHFHLLLRNGNGFLAPMMRRLMTGHAVTFNLRHQRQGHLFQNRYKSIVVEEETYFLELVRYIHLNPVRAGIVMDMEELATHKYAGHSVIMGKVAYEAQDTEAVLARFSAKRGAAVSGYCRFVAAGLSQGTREDLQGGGLLRSSGGAGAIASRSLEEGELSDERILGSGDFVEAVLGERDDSEMANKNDGNRHTIEDVLKEVAEKSGVRCEEMLGASRNRKVSRARGEFYLKASERAVANLSALARLTGRSHVAVRMAIEKAKEERKKMKNME